MNIMFLSSCIMDDAVVGLLPILVVLCLLLWTLMLQFRITLNPSLCGIFLHSYMDMTIWEMHGLVEDINLPCSHYFKMFIFSTPKEDSSCLIFIWNTNIRMFTYSIYDYMFVFLGLTVLTPDKLCYSPLNLLMVIEYFRPLSEIVHPI